MSAHATAGKALDLTASTEPHKAIAFHITAGSQARGGVKSGPYDVMLGPSPANMSRIVIRKNTRGRLEYAKISSGDFEFKPYAKLLTEAEMLETAGPSVQIGAPHPDLLREIGAKLEKGQMMVLLGLPVVGNVYLSRAPKGSSERVPAEVLAEHPHFIRKLDYYHAFGITGQAAVNDTRFIRLFDDDFREIRAEFLRRVKSADPKAVDNFTLHHTTHPHGKYSVIVVASNPVSAGA